MVAFAEAALGEYHHIVDIGHKLTARRDTAKWRGWPYVVASGDGLPGKLNSSLRDDLI